MAGLTVHLSQDRQSCGQGRPSVLIDSPEPSISSAVHPAAGSAHGKPVLSYPKSQENKHFAASQQVSLDGSGTTESVHHHAKG